VTKEFNKSLHWDPRDKTQDEKRKKHTLMVHQNILHAVLVLRLQGVDGVGNGRRVVEVFVLVEQFHSRMVLLNIIIWKQEKKKHTEKSTNRIQKIFCSNKEENKSTRKVPTEFNESI
jgi:hypothetical protein